MISQREIAKELKKELVEEEEGLKRNGKGYLELEKEKWSKMSLNCKCSKLTVTELCICRLTDIKCDFNNCPVRYWLGDIENGN